MPRGSLENRQILPIAVEGGKGNDGRRDRHLSSVIAGDGEEGEWVNDSDEVASRRIKFKVGLVFIEGGSFSAPRCFDST